MIRSAACLSSLIFLLVSGAVHCAGTGTQPEPFARGDPGAGKTLSDKDCVACHASRFDGDAAKIYLRNDRKVKTPAQLLAQVGRCNAELRTGYFPEEEEHVAAYLNVHYYKFKP